MGIDLTMVKDGVTVSEKRGNLFCFVLRETTGIDLCEDGVCVAFSNEQLHEVSNALNAFTRARMAWKIEARKGFTIGEAIEFVAEYADWIEESANAGCTMHLC